MVFKSLCSFKAHSDCIQVLNTEQRTHQVIVSQNIFFSDEPMMEFMVKTNLLHHLVDNHNFNMIHKLMYLASTAQIQRLLGLKDRNGKIPSELAQTDEIKALFSWVTAQHSERFYPLLTPPNLIIMYTTDGRPGAEAERDNLKKALPHFILNVEFRENPTESEMVSVLRDTMQTTDMPSALIVIIMMHGTKGAVKAKDKYVNINTILLEMNHQKLTGKPKVCLLFVY